MIRALKSQMLQFRRVAFEVEERGAAALPSARCRAFRGMSTRIGPVMTGRDDFKREQRARHGVEIKITLVGVDLDVELRDAWKVSQDLESTISQAVVVERER